MHPDLNDLLGSAYSFLKDVTSKTQVMAMTSGSVEIDKILAYPLKAKGHMLRPLLVYLTAMTADGPIPQDIYDRLVIFAAAVELIHNASLIHDDLIDGEEMRRGEESLYKRYGQTTAILSGNCYYIKALELANEYLDSKMTGEILQTAFKMCTGELLQGAYKDKQMPDQVYIDVVKAKTGGLTALACKGTAIITGSFFVEYWEEIGSRIGVLYQLKDDLKDKDANVRPDFNYERTLSQYLKETEELLEKINCTERNKRFSELIRIF